jgi:hypothetical protein
LAAWFKGSRRDVVAIHIPPLFLTVKKEYSDLSYLYCHILLLINLQEHLRVPLSILPPFPFANAVHRGRNQDGRVAEIDFSRAICSNTLT